MMSTYTKDVPLDGEGIFIITILATCEAVQNIIRQRHGTNEKIRYYLDRMDRDIEGINRQFDGYIPDDIVARTTEYHDRIESAMTWLLTGEDNEQIHSEV